MNEGSTRILAQDHIVSNNTWVTGVNNNDLIIGPSGAGKTRNYVKPNLLQCDHSLIIADTKGSLIEEMGPVMAGCGFHVINLDFTDLLNNTWGYNPLDYIRYDSKRKKYSEQDIMIVSNCLIPVETERDPFWEQSAQLYLAALISYVLETLPKEEHNLETVCRLYKMMETKEFARLFDELEAERPDSYACQTYRMVSGNQSAKQTQASVRMFLVKNLGPLTFDGPVHLYKLKRRVEFKTLGKEKTAVFLTISDTERSMDKLVNLFYTQALNQLCESADKDYKDHRLPVPVRFILDDFATNVRIPDFDKIISVIRSREIYVSLIIQSITQLYDLYEVHKGKTILNNCDNWLYLGGQDVDTANSISTRANKPLNKVLEMPLGDAWLFIRGQKPQQVRKYDLKSHPLYHKLPEGKGTPAPLPAPEVVPAPEPAQEPEPALPGFLTEYPDLPEYEGDLVLGGADVNPAEFMDVPEWDGSGGDPFMDPPENETAPAPESVPEPALRGPLDIWLDDSGVSLTKFMDEQEHDELRSRKRELAAKTARLEAELMGRNRPVLPEVTDGNGRYSEKKTWALVRRLLVAIKDYDYVLGVDNSRQTSRQLACLRAFLYCAIRLSAVRPAWPGHMELEGTFDDILRLARRVECFDQVDLHFREMYDSGRLNGFFGWMDEVCQKLTGIPVRNRISAASSLMVRERHWDFISIQDALMRSWEESHDEQEEVSDDPEPAALVENAERWAWVEDFPEKETFCQCYLFLWENCFEGDFLKELPTHMEEGLDTYLASESDLPIMQDERFSRACGALEANTYNYSKFLAAFLKKARALGWRCDVAMGTEEGMEDSAIDLDFSWVSPAGSKYSFSTYVQNDNDEKELCKVILGEIHNFFDADQYEDGEAIKKMMYELAWIAKELTSK